MVQKAPYFLLDKSFLVKYNDDEIKKVREKYARFVNKKWKCTTF